MYYDKHGIAFQKAHNDLVRPYIINEQARADRARADKETNKNIDYFETWKADIEKKLPEDLKKHYHQFNIGLEEKQEFDVTDSYIDGVKEHYKYLIYLEKPRGYGSINHYLYVSVPVTDDSNYDYFYKKGLRVVTDIVYSFNAQN
jgi:hypothetical protein